MRSRIGGWREGGKDGKRKAMKAIKTRGSKEYAKRVEERERE